MTRHTFFCIDAHTCGNPVRVVAGGAPYLNGESMSDYRQDFLARYDWIRRGLMFEPRGHDMMSGALFYRPLRAGCEVGIVFIETSGCLPMCGHGTIGSVTIALEEGLVTPRVDGRLNLDTPAGLVTAEYVRDGRWVDKVKLYNVGSWLEATDVPVEVPGFGVLHCDIAYGGNFYAIFEPQQNFAGLDQLDADDILRLSPIVRRRLNAIVAPVHPENPTIGGVSHVMWTGPPRAPDADARNAVFYGERAIDRSPCGTGTSARVAQLVGRGKLGLGERFIHESLIGSCFEARAEAALNIGPHRGIQPSIAGWARITGHNTLFIDDRDPFAHGFTVK
jgi:4-hydroxyproline epimerase